MTTATTPDTTPLLLRNAALVGGGDGAAADTSQPLDLLIDGDRLVAVGPALDAPESATVVDLGGAYVSAGWLDLYARGGEPGLEHRETTATLLAAAAAGGFAGVAIAPETEPPIDTREGVAFAAAQAVRTASGVAAHVVGALTKRRAGGELAELWDLADAGAVAFSDGVWIADAGLMRRALEYAAMLDRPVLLFPHDRALAGGGLVHEGTAGTRAGAMGIPEVAETAALARDLLLAADTGARVHVLHATTRRSLDLIRDARARGTRVTASVSAAHLALTDEAVEASGFDAATKLLPPLRSAADRAALLAALADGTLDAVFSDHAPHALHETEVEFAAAPFGVSALETTWAVLSTHAVAEGRLSVEQAAALLTSGPRRCLGLPPLAVETGARAALTVFDASTPWTFDARRMRSLGRQTPFDGAAMTGRVRGIVAGGRFVDALPRAVEPARR